MNQNLVSFHQVDLLGLDATNLFLSWLEDEHSSGGANSSSSRGKEGKGQSQRYNLIVSNPPYIAHSEYETLEPEVAQWEDPKALLADQEGLVFYPRIAHMAMELLHRQPAASQSSSSSSSSSESSSSIVAAGGQNIKQHVRELDPTTLERMDTLDHDEQQHRNNSNNNDSYQGDNKRAQDDEEDIEGEDVERTWRNGPELDRVKIPELVFEIGGDHQVDFVSAAVRQAGFRRVQVWKDLADRARCIVGAR